MFKLKNIFITNQRAYICGEMVDFDAEGVGEMTIEKSYKAALELPNFFAIEEEKKKEEQKEKKEEQEKTLESDTKVLEQKEEKVKKVVTKITKK